ncbi:hypothetical protein [Spirillospora sp. NBC_01491]|uniref:hypothetical protein n=1 Tax=Spirillospora sp. NBC_01491 TaxID=2976007 RepID=UPI002E34E06F|nr:hypothetical protein [Spirillospora sp. NBC_01491]
MNVDKRLHTAAQVLMTLVTRADLPPICTWRMDDTDGLSGQLAAADDTAVLHDLAAAARSLGTPGEPLEIQRKAYDAHPDSTRVWVTAQVDGVEVEIWSAIRTTSLPEGGAA